MFKKKEPERPRKWWALLPLASFTHFKRHNWVTEQVSHIFVRALDDPCIAKLRDRIGQSFQPLHPEDDRPYLVVFLNIKYGKVALQEDLGFVQTGALSSNWNWLAVQVNDSQDNYGFPNDGKIPEIIRPFFGKKIKEREKSECPRNSILL
jgi:hypothetical protein